jgi:hypothetical protein
MAPLLPARRLAWFALICGLFLCASPAYARPVRHLRAAGHSAGAHVIGAAGTFAPRVWLSRSQAAGLRSLPLVRIVVVDANGDGQPERFALDDARRPGRWKSAGRGRAVPPRRGMPHARRGSTKTFDTDSLPPDDVQQTPYGAPPALSARLAVIGASAESVLGVSRIDGAPRPIQCATRSSPRAPPARPS